MSDLSPWACALLVIAAYTFSGLAQTAWLKSAWSARFAVPLDGGRTWRGRRIFGANKTWRGVVVLVPATGLAFVAVAWLVQLGAHGGAGALFDMLAARIWHLSFWQWAWLGGVSALGYLAAELPNSFVKRRLGIAPGQGAATAGGRSIAFLVDQIDSTLGVILGIALLVPVTWKFCLLVIGMGAVWHWCFTYLLYLLGLKQRPA